MSQEAQTIIVVAAPSTGDMAVEVPNTEVALLFYAWLKERNYKVSMGNPWDVKVINSQQGQQFMDALVRQFSDDVTSSPGGDLEG